MVADFPKRLELLKDLLRRHDPLGIVASFAVYGLQTTVGPRGVSTTSLLKDIQQHHAELLQAVMLTIPFDQWGKQPFTAEVMQTFFDTVPLVSETFLHQRLLAAEQTRDKQENTQGMILQSLQERIRFSTQMVRNWGYYSHVIRITTELYGPLDQKLAAHHGFGVTDLIQVVESLINEFKSRTNRHWSTLAKVLRGANASKVIRLYYKYVPDLVGSPEEMIAALPSGITRDMAIGLVMSHFDLRLPDLTTFQTADIAELTKRPPDMVERILTAISRPPGDLVSTKPEHLFLANPVWTAPGILLPEGFFIPMPQVVFSHIHDVVRQLADAAGLKDELERLRARYLETQLEDALRAALPGASITPGVSWNLDGKRFETDVLIIADRTVLIAEAKSHHLTPEGLRGAPARVKRHIQDLVLDPSIQSARLESLIAAARNGDVAASVLVRELSIDPSKVDRVIRLSVTLDDFSVISSLEGELKEIGWVPADHKLAPSIHLSDLNCIFDILGDPVFILHYLSERNYFQSSFELLGDELDFLGLYLKTGFNLGYLENEEALFSPSGMSEPIDRYYMSLEAGVRLPKPKVKLQPIFRKIIERLSERRPEGWITICIHLLASADFNEQKELDRNLNKLREIVRKNCRDPRHLSSVQIQPPQNRKAVVIFYLFPESLRSSYKKSMEQLASEALEQADRETCLVFGRSIDNWGIPYEAVYLMGKAETAEG